MEKRNQNIVAWSSPSNIAIVKYWGKREQQIPENPSISFTLENCKTETKIAYRPSDTFGIDFRFEGVPNEKFKQRIEQYFNTLLKYMPWLQEYQYDIDSSNTFPHSSGIASSASAMSAMALCLCEIESQVYSTRYNQEELLNRASFISRLGSGSACRSVYAKCAMWGQTEIDPSSSNLYAIGLSEMIHKEFQSWDNAICIVSNEVKSVSSSAGHALMNNNPYATKRYQEAKKNCSHVYNALKAGDVERFGTILESEALQLHALMMCSQPSFILMKAESLNIIEKVKAYRKHSKIPVYFTLDAGPNIHMLYPSAYRQKVNEFIQHEIKPLCHNERWIQDKVGDGPLKINLL